MIATTHDPIYEDILENEETDPIYEDLLDSGEIDMKTRFLVWTHLPRHALDPRREEDETLYASETLEFPEEKVAFDFAELTNPKVPIGSMMLLYSPERMSKKSASFVAEIKYY
jgi:hypothetical protein